MATDNKRVTTRLAPKKFEQLQRSALKRQLSVYQLAKKVLEDFLIRDE